MNGLFISINNAIPSVTSTEFILVDKNNKYYGPARYYHHEGWRFVGGTCIDIKTLDLAYYCNATDFYRTKLKSLLNELESYKESCWNLIDEVDLSELSNIISKYSKAYKFELPEN